MIGYLVTLETLSTFLLIKFQAGYIFIFIKEPIQLAGFYRNVVVNSFTAKGYNQISCDIFFARGRAEISNLITWVKTYNFYAMNFSRKSYF